MAVNPPNALSFLRIFAVPVFIWMMLERHESWALWIFIAAGVTDALDGYIAKRFNMQTVLGSYLDPIADKLLLVSGFITLTVVNGMPLWLTLLVVTRDLVIIGGAVVFHLMTSRLEMDPLWISKLNTATQIVLLTAALVRDTFQMGHGLVEGLIWVTAATTVTSGLWYVIEWSQRLTPAMEAQAHDALPPGEEPRDSARKPS
ncbi:MAG: CDP-alcohol phosphatidyltransferase family protein [Magnetococcales bacterium]|nr:CDP-alcohol phosphatidyltransferase family protein [Magnetococcales bacterium]